MTSVAEILVELKKLGMQLHVEGSQLKVRAPDGVMTSDIAAQIQSRKSAIIEYLKSDNSPLLTRQSDEDRLKPQPLSNSQERLWFIEQLEDVGGLNNICMAVRLSGQLNVLALEASLNEIVARHETLRSQIVESSTGTPEQIVCKADFRLARRSCASDSIFNEQILMQMLEEEWRAGFDLTDALKLRGVLIGTDDQAAAEHMLVLTAHHIAFDGASMELLWSELQELYASHGLDVSPELPELPMQYLDYVNWQRATLADSNVGAQINYWVDRLANAPTLQDLPIDRPRPAIQNYTGDNVTFSISSELTRSLQSVGGAQGATMYVTLLAAFSVLLSRYSSSEDVLIGTPVANRGRVELEPLLGFFVNTLVLRNSLSDKLSLVESLQVVRNGVLEAMQHQDLPFERLVEQLNPERSSAFTPLFQVMFQLQNRIEASLTLKDLAVSAVTGSDKTAKFDLTLFVEETDQGLEGYFNFRTELFERATIERMVGHWQRVLEQMVSSPQLKLSQLSLLSDAERDQLVEQVNATHSEYPQQHTLVDQFVEQALRDGDAVALEDTDGTLYSYAQLDRESNALANYLRNESVGRGDRVGVYLERGAPMLRVLLAIMKSGASYVPLDPMFPDERLAFMAEDASLKVVLTQEALQESVPGEGVKRFVLEEVEAKCSSAESPEATVNNSHPEDAAYVIYTSGSTGQPKGVQVSHRSLQNFLCSMQQRPGLSSTDRLLAVTTLSFDIAGLELYLPLVVGARVVLCSQEQSMDPSALSARLESSGATVMQATPASWKMLLEWGWQGAKSLRVLCGGEPLSRDLADRLLECCGELWNLYGPTETTIWSTVSQISAGDEPITVGRPIANTQVYVLDEQMGVQPQGVSGELYIGGDGVAQGYLGRQELTAERFVVDPFSTGTDAKLYRTGDRARWRTNGELEIQGRLDDQVKLRGYRIEPGEIRAVLVHEPQIRDAVVVVREDGQAGSQLVAYVVTETETGKSDEPGEPLSVERMRELLKHKVPEYMVPSVWMQLEKLPLTPNGKVDKQQLPAPQGQESAIGHEYVAPVNEQERLIASVWESVLNIDKVGRHDDFFVLGGHSLKAVQVVARLRKNLVIELPVRILFEYSTVEGLASQVDSLQASLHLKQPTDMGDGRSRLVL